MTPMTQPNPIPFDDEERDLIDRIEAALDNGTLKSHLTPERQAELQAAAKATLNPPKK